MQALAFFMEKRTLTLIGFIFFVIVCGIIYSPSLTAPFYLDDYSSIANNVIIKDGISWSALELYYPLRELPYFSFSLHYYFGLTEPLHFHVVSLLLHLLIVLGTYKFCEKLFSFTYSELSSSRKAAFAVALLFMVLPLNSQTVIYSVQRIALFSALFYIWGVNFYLDARKNKHHVKIISYLLLTCLCFYLGLHSKQNIVTLPVVLVFLEIFVLKTIKIERLKKYFLIGISIVLFFWLVDFLLQLQLLQLLDKSTKTTDFYTRWTYFSHQLTQIWIYIYKFFVPFPLLLEYQVKPFNWDNAQTWFALLGHGLVIGGAVRLAKNHPVAIFLIVSFYTAHIVESSFITIDDLGFEHRAYLPNVFLAALVIYLSSTIKNVTALSVVFAVLISVFSVLTFDRAQLWARPLDFYRQNLTYTFDSSRAYGAIATIYASDNKMNSADKWTRISIQEGINTGKISTSTIVAYMNLLADKGNTSKAKEAAVRALTATKRSKDKASILVALARVKLSESDDCSFVEGIIKRAKHLDPLNAQAFHLATLCGIKD